jgi:hypothetical protein
MCGYCTENNALTIADHLRLHGTLPAEMVGEPNFFSHILQEDDELLSRTGESDVLDQIFTDAEAPIPLWYASILLARKLLAQTYIKKPFSPRGEYFLQRAALCKNFTLDDDPLAALQHYIDTCIQAADEPDDDSLRSEFDVYANLLTLVKGILLAGTCDKYTALLSRLAAGYPRNSPPFFDGIELWLQRLALIELWHRHGLSAVQALIRLHIRPMLLLYLHYKKGLTIDQRQAIVNALTAEGCYASPSAEFDWVIEQLLNEG